MGEAAGMLSLLLSSDIQHLGAPNVIGLARLFCYRDRQEAECSIAGTMFQLVEVPPNKAKAEREKLSKDGWIVAHTEIV